MLRCICHDQCCFPPESQIKLKHRDTGMYLMTNEHAKFGQPIAGQQEVACIQRADKNCEWVTAEGVYFPKTEEEGAEAPAAADEL